MSELLTFQREVGQWGRETFGNYYQRVEGVVEHLAREVQELADTHDPAEAADCLILLLGHADIMGYDLLLAARIKMEINRRRQWGKPDAYGVVEHVRNEVGGTLEPNARPHGPERSDGSVQADVGFPNQGEMT
jgi:NTP pyrophosphatase (non-canonical NTP hydrolase)